MVRVHGLLWPCDMKVRWDGSWKISVFPDHPGRRGLVEFKASDLRLLQKAADNKKK